nr:hypothetical protein [Brevibacillus laterosporus]
MRLNKKFQNIFSLLFAVLLLVTPEGFVSAEDKKEEVGAKQ